MSSTVFFNKRQTAAPGSNQNQGSNSLSGILSTLIPVFIVAAASFAGFLILRKRYNNIYSPRSSDTILKQETRRTPGDRGFLNGLFNFKGLPDDFVLEHNSLDGYLFLRFFKILIVISTVGLLITWPILFPVNATGGGGQTQLNVLSWSNVANPNRYYAQVFVAWIYLGFVSLVVVRERMVLIGLRQAYFLSSIRAKRLTSRTVLFMGIPKESRSVEALKQLLGGDVRNIWMNTNCDDLEDAVTDRDDLTIKLEGAQVKLSKQAGKQLQKERKEAEKSSKTHTISTDVKQYIDPKKRPTHRLKFLIGKKVDTIEYAQTHLHEMTRKVELQQEQHAQLKDSELAGSAFVEFTSQHAAQRAYQFAAHSKKKTMQPRVIDVDPKEVVWKNMKENYATRKAKMIVATILVSLVILFWTPIILFVGAVSNINYLTTEVPFLSFINNIPSVILGIVTGLLPVVILAVVVALVPILMRLLAKKAGEPTLGAVELKTQSWYFAFQVIQVFLITTFSSGASAVAAQIVRNPGSAVSLLAKNLPKASNFFISYIILLGLAQAGSMFLNVAAVAIFFLLSKFLDSTPRKMYNRWLKLAGIGWGSEYPKWTNLGVIVLAYSCIAPLILGFSLIGFILLYLAFRYRWLFVLGNQIDMKGLAYSKALQQMMWGVYLSCLCMIGLLAIGTAGASAGSGPLVLMIIFFVVVVIFQILANYALKPLESGLPLDLVSTDAYDYEAENKTHTNNTDNTYINGPNRERIGSDDTNVDSYPQNSSNEKSKTTEITGNKLTQRLRPMIDRKYFEPMRNRHFELADIDYTYDDAYYNPAIKAEQPLVWLARDELGVSRRMVEENREANIDSTDDYAWFDEKNKLHWDSEHLPEVQQMIESRKGLSEKKQDQVGQQAIRQDQGKSEDGVEYGGEYHAHDGGR